MSAECPSCQRSFKNEVGLATHHGRKHLPPIDGWCSVADCPKRAKVQSKNGIQTIRRLCSMHQKRRETEAARKAGKTCSVISCDKPTSQSLQYCAMHASRLHRLGDVLADVPPNAIKCVFEICAAENCDRPRYRYNGAHSSMTNPLCIAHLWRRRVYGDVFAGIPVPAKKGALKAAAEAMSIK